MPLAALALVAASAAARLAVAQEVPARVAAHPVEVRTVHDRSTGLPSDDVLHVELDAEGRPVVTTSAGVFRLDAGRWQPHGSPPARLEAAPARAGIRQSATSRDGRTAEARTDGLFLKGRGGQWERVRPSDGRRSWAPVDVRGVAFDGDDRLWFAAPQGVGRLDGANRTL